METKLGSTEYQKLGEALAHAYVEKNISLNKSLEKIATDLNLNHTQATRVAEIANVETYLALNKKQGGYIDFELASANSIKTAEFKPDIEGAYFSSPNAQSDNWLESLYPGKQLAVEKTASATDLEDFLNYDKIRKSLEQKEVKLEETSTKLASQIESINSDIKQYVLNGTKVEDVLGVVKLASEAHFLITDSYAERPSEFKPFEVEKTTKLFTKTAALKDLLLNWVADYNTLQKEAELIDTIQSKANKGLLEKTAANLIGPNSRKIAENLSGQLDKHPLLTSAMMVAPAPVYLFLIKDSKPEPVEPQYITFSQRP